MLLQHDLPKMFWEDAAIYANYLRNLSPTRALKGTTPYEVFFGKKGSVEDLQEFGTNCWVLIPDSKRSKLDAKSEKFTYLGISESGAGYKYFHKPTRQVLTSRNVEFDRIPDPDTVIQPIVPSQPAETSPSLEGEKSTGKGKAKKLPPVVTEPAVTRAKPRLDYHKLHDSGTTRGIPMKDPVKVPLPTSPPPEEPDSPLTPESSNLCFVTTEMSDAPQSLEEAKKRPDWPQWLEAMQIEMGQLLDLHTYDLTELPQDRKAIGCRWVYSLKRDASGNIIKRKARLVAQGFSQIPGQDFAATYAPVMRLELFRALLAIGAVMDYEIHQMDVVGAYLNSELSEEIYMKQPPGYDDGSGRVCGLVKAIYGLKQAGQAWNEKFNRIFVDILKYKRIHPDYCVYVRMLNTGDVVYIIIHVDDMALLAPTLTEMDFIKGEIRPHLKITDLGEIKTFVGLKIERDRPNRLIKISQPHYIDTILHRFGMEKSNPVSTPLDPNVKLLPTPPDLDPATMADIPYQTAIGSLMYAAVATRPDISFAVQALSQFNANPSPLHWTAVKHVLRYLKGTQQLGITYGRIQDIAEEGWTDADWAQCLLDRRSTSGYVFIMAGGAVSWSSKKQQTVALSTMEAEYLALAHATKEAIWLRSLRENLGFEGDGSTQINCNNMSAIAFAHDHQFHARSKHIDIRHHFIREHITSDHICVIHVPTEDNIADILTKPLTRSIHQRHVASLGLSTY
ncbi:hypothetical protein NLI96_g11880 [Meripilus lineatus]|uniref:Reverse transcriptase Ty1/copia-type domain-containing protein n=1 Tax=Meripilus lineatus TaxID=2056292 RepID=A0AAD5UV32_9APHY|nr:hypothetical protein NLI96_g11880 [Physisporinus lineatus]